MTENNSILENACYIFYQDGINAVSFSRITKDYGTPYILLKKQYGNSILLRKAVISSYLTTFNSFLRKPNSTDSLINFDLVFLRNLQDKPGVIHTVLSNDEYSKLIIRFLLTLSRKIIDETFILPSEDLVYQNLVNIFGILTLANNQLLDLNSKKLTAWIFNQVNRLNFSLALQKELKIDIEKFKSVI